MAERSPDRQARVAAIEFLHAVLLWMVGEHSRSLCESGGVERDLIRSCAQAYFATSILSDPLCTRLLRFTVPCSACRR